ncbi:MAG TPA: hypothetical protein VI072_11105 [Polyangiaceae bacterium]
MIRAIEPHRDSETERLAYLLERFEGGVLVGVFELRNLLLAHACALTELFLCQLGLVASPPNEKRCGEARADGDARELSAFRGTRVLHGAGRDLTVNEVRFEPTFERLARCFCKIVTAVGEGLAPGQSGNSASTCFPSREM